MWKTKEEWRKSFAEQCFFSRITIGAGVKSNNLSQVITMLTRDVEWLCNTSASTSTIACLWAWAYNKVAYSRKWMPPPLPPPTTLPQKKSCIRATLHDVLYSVAYTHSSVVRFFIWSSLACVCGCVFLTLIHHAPVIIIITITKEHLTEKFLNENEWVRVCASVSVTMIIMWRVDTAKTYTHFILYTRKNKNEWTKKSFTDR